MKFNGKRKAIVEDINDPKEMRRIRVIIPSIDSELVSKWALPSDSTTYEWLPKKEDLVWVEWENCDSFGELIWSGRLPAKDDIDSDFTDIYEDDDYKDDKLHLYRKQFDYNDNHIIWTPSGIKIVTSENYELEFIKNDDNEEIKIKIDNDVSFLLDKKNNKAELKLDDNYSILLDKDNEKMMIKIDDDYSILLDKSNTKCEVKANGNKLLMDSSGTNINDGKLFVPK